ncbi:MAG: ABC transporter substrate-binding protein [Candidatus Aminicenantes bacterium]|nr:ABC transporter substrate-binding protein [Candidatus Aminicenantes bacterium]
MSPRALSAGFLSLLLFVPGCRAPESGKAGEEPPAAAEPYVIGIFQSVDSPTANEVRRGILQAFAEAGLRDGLEIVVRIRIANNDIAEVQRIARDLVAENVDMIMPLSTQSLQAAILTARRTPIVFSAVAVPFLVGAGRSADDHLAHVTGVASTGPVGRTLALIREALPGARRVGSLWTSSEVNSEYYLDLARETAAELGLEIVAVPVASGHEIPRSLQALLNEKVDVLFPMSDNTLNSAFDAIGRAADENRLPLFGSFLRSAEFGACAALGYDFYEMGLKTGRIAVRVMNGESPAGIPIQTMDEVRLHVNPAAAERQGIALPRAVLDRADRIVSAAPGAAPAAAAGLVWKP